MLLIEKILVEPNLILLVANLELKFSYFLIDHIELLHVFLLGLDLLLISEEFAVFGKV